MRIADVAKLSSMNRLLYWIQEREAIRLRRRAKQPKPWTDDEILQSYRFCNVRRMDDKVSLWLLERWYKPNFDHPNMLPAIALARHFNKPNTLTAIGFPHVWNKEEIKRRARKLRDIGVPIFNGAYVVTGRSGEDKIDTVVDGTVQPIVDNPPKLDTNSMEACWQEIRSYRGFGSFMAGQVVADMRWATEGTWEDKHTWAPAGPGSMRGLNRLHGRPLSASINQEDFLEQLQDLMLTCIERLSTDIVSRLEAMDYQSCLCEFDKYERAITNEGKPKQRYQGA